MTMEMADRQAAYIADYQFRRNYNALLKDKVIDVINPILDQEVVPQEARQQLEEILLGQNGKIQVSSNTIKALFEAGLLGKGLMSSNGQVDDPGWRHIDEDGMRYVSYFLGLDEHLTGRSPATMGLRIKTEDVVAKTPEEPRKRDFTHWVIQRD